MASAFFPLFRFFISFRLLLLSFFSPLYLCLCRCWFDMHKHMHTPLFIRSLYVSVCLLILILRCFCICNDFQHSQPNSNNSHSKLNAKLASLNWNRIECKPNLNIFIWLLTHSFSKETLYARVGSTLFTSCIQCSLNWLWNNNGFTSRTKNERGRARGEGHKCLPFAHSISKFAHQIELLLCVGGSGDDGNLKYWYYKVVFDLIWFQPSAHHRHHQHRSDCRQIDSENFFNSHQ